MEYFDLKKYFQMSATENGGKPRVAISETQIYIVKAL